MFSLFQFLGDSDLRLTILDVGAAFLDAPSYQSLVDAGRARIIGFEPDPEACRKLNEKYGEPHRFLPYFIGDGAQATYYETNWGPTGSLFMPNTSLLEKFQLLAEVTTVVGEHPVVTRRLDDLPEIDDIDFVKIDVQGAELGIFQNASRVLGQVLLIQTEVGFVESYSGQPMFSDVDAFLRRNGFQFHDFVGMGSRSFKPLTNPADPSGHPMTRSFRQKIWADALYVKDWMKLDRLAPGKLRKLAVLMHDLLGSYDLAHAVLEEHDRQTGSDYARRYLHRLGEWGRCSIVHAKEFDSDWLPIQRGQSNGEDGSHGMAGRVESILLETNDGTLVSVPTSLNCTTTYVLLEQERWFERELSFLLDWLKPGMNAVDIGANVGVYSLAMARCVSPGGSVFAFEPGSENRRNLEVGRSANRIRNLCISASAVAESDRTGWLRIMDSGDLNTLVEGTEPQIGAEPVEVKSIDTLEHEQHWPSIDFLKVDAEGQERNIILGGRRFLEQQSPLLMFEMRHVDAPALDIRPLLGEMGYSVFRLTGDAALLIPLADADPVDPFELNVFAAKQDRAARLADSGLLAWGTEPHRLSADERDLAVGRLLELPYARGFEFSADDVLSGDLAPALVAYAAYRFLPLPPERKYSALKAAFEQARIVCDQSATATNLVTLARLAHAIGYRQFCVDTLQKLFATPVGDADAPFLPPCPRFDYISPVGSEQAWFMVAAIEQLELSRAHSSQYVWQDGFVNLKHVCDSPFASAEFIRRIVLTGLLRGVPPEELSAYTGAAHQYQHKNSFFWTEDELSSLARQAYAQRRDGAKGLTVSNFDGK